MSPVSAEELPGESGEHRDLLKKQGMPRMCGLWVLPGIHPEALFLLKFRFEFLCTLPLDIVLGLW